MIIAAVKTREELDAAKLSGVKILFDLNPSILTLDDRVREVHACGKRIFLHVDLAEGIGKDKAGLQYVKQKKVDGIISTRVNIIKTAREVGLFTVQRFFAVDSHSIDTTLESIKASKPDMIEVMPGIATKVIAKLKGQLNIPIIGGGLVDTAEEVRAIMRSGASGVSTSKKELWELMK